MKKICVIMGLLLVPTVFLSGCGLHHLAREQMEQTALNVVAVYDRETDIELARAALPAGIKFLEGAVAADSTNSQLLVAASRALGRYTWAFVERDLALARWAKDSASVTLLEARARLLYRRAATYGERALLFSGFPDPFDRLTGQAAAEALERAENCHEEGLFWTAFALANLIGSEKTFADMQESIDRVLRMFERVAKSSDSGLAALAHTSLGVLLIRLPPLMGGNTDDAKAHFEQAIAVTDSSYLPARLAYAVEYVESVNGPSTGTQELLRITRDFPEMRCQWGLDNAVARERARDYLEQKDVLADH